MARSPDHPQAFSRTRKLPLPTLVCALLSFRGASAQSELDCARRPNFDHPCRLNIDQGWKHISSEACCG